MKPNRGDLQVVAEQWMSLWKGGDLELVETLHALNFVDHSSEHRDQDLCAFKSGIIELYAAFPDFHANILHVIVDETQSLVSIIWSAEGVQHGTFAGFKPSKGRIFFTGIEVIRVADSKIVERWGEWNSTSIFEQIRSFTKPDAH